MKERPVPPWSGPLPAPATNGNARRPQIPWLEIGKLLLPAVLAAYASYQAAIVRLSVLESDVAQIRSQVQQLVNMHLSNGVK
jgi:hypothetical protein